MKQEIKKAETSGEVSAFYLVVKINPQFYWGSGKTEQGYKQTGRALSKPKESLPCVRGGGTRSVTEGLLQKKNNPSPPTAELPLHKGAY